VILILMGVSGIGKTTIGKGLATCTGWTFEDADDYHSEANRKKMAAGVPLNDEDRAPWLATVHERLTQYFREGKSVIFACSALKQKYREQLAEGFAENDFRFVYLFAPVDLIRERIQLRDHAYMNPKLLDSQVETLEEPSAAWPVSVAGTPEQSVNEILARMRKAGKLANGGRTNDHSNQDS
jgi:gluconokinase